MDKMELDHFLHTLSNPTLNHLLHELQFERLDFLIERRDINLKDGKKEAADLYEAAIKLQKARSRNNEA
jgi:hypothetical protein